MVNLLCRFCSAVFLVCSQTEIDAIRLSQCPSNWHYSRKTQRIVLGYETTVCTNYMKNANVWGITCTSMWICILPYLYKTTCYNESAYIVLGLCDLQKRTKTWSVFYLHKHEKNLLTLFFPLVTQNLFDVFFPPSLLLNKVPPGLTRLCDTS